MCSRLNRERQRRGSTTVHTAAAAEQRSTFQDHRQRQWHGCVRKLSLRFSCLLCSSSVQWWALGHWNRAMASQTWLRGWSSGGRDPNEGGRIRKTWQCHRVSPTWPVTPRWSSPNPTATTVYSMTCTYFIICGTARQRWTISTYTGTTFWCHTGTPRSPPATLKEGTRLPRTLPQVFTRSWGRTVPETRPYWSHTCLRLKQPQQVRLYHLHDTRGWMGLIAVPPGRKNILWYCYMQPFISVSNITTGHAPILHFHCQYRLHIQILRNQLIK